VVTIQIAELLDVAKETGQHIEKGQRLAAYASTARMKGKMFLVPRVPGSPLECGKKSSFATACSDLLSIPAAVHPSKGSTAQFQHLAGKRPCLRPSKAAH
jgi:hypothetical protein